jgi:hypothetical protein
MNELTLTYTGEDLIIPRPQLEALGLKPGDRLIISAAPPDPAASRQEIESILNDLARAAPGAAKDAERELRQLLDKLKPGD